MVQRASPLFKNKVIFDFDRDSIVHVAVRAYIEASLYEVSHLSTIPCNSGWWEGDFDNGAFFDASHSPDYNLVAWNEVGVVGLSYELGCGPIENRDLSPDAVTGGPDDVRGAVPDLPDELEPVFLRAVGLLWPGYRKERLAGVGFWVLGDQAGGSFFSATEWICGAFALAAWGLLKNCRLRRTCGDAFHDEPEQPEEGPIQEVIEALLERLEEGPTELTAAELEIVLRPDPDPKKLLDAQRDLQKVGITWPGSPELPPESVNPGFLAQQDLLTRIFGRLHFDRNAIVRVALRAYVETTLAPLDPQARHTLPACVTPKWVGDFQRGAFFDGDGCGNCSVVAWTETGIVALAYKRGATPTLPLGAVLPGLPDELLPALEMAAGLLDVGAVGADGAKLVSIGVWQLGDRMGGTLVKDPTLPGGRWLVPWGKLDAKPQGRLRLLYDNRTNGLAAVLARTIAAPIHALIDAVTDRAMKGPTELLPTELATLFPHPPDPAQQLSTAWRLGPVGITWPGIPALSAAPPGIERLPCLTSLQAIGRCHSLGYLVFDKEAIIRAAFRGYIEEALAGLNPAQYHPMHPDCGHIWTGDLQQGALVGRLMVAWSEAGVVIIVFDQRGYPLGSGPKGPVATNPLDVRGVVLDLPEALVPALEMACGALDQQHTLYTARLGFWLCGNQVGGSFFDAPMSNEVWCLANWGRLGQGRVLPVFHDSSWGEHIKDESFQAFAPFLALVDDIVARALQGPLELTVDEVVKLYPVPPLPGPALRFLCKLQQVGITWPGSSEPARG